jgi:hypothetical protein
MTLCDAKVYLYIMLGDYIVYAMHAIDDTIAKVHQLQYKTCNNPKNT